MTFINPYWYLVLGYFVLGNGFCHIGVGFQLFV